MNKMQYNITYRKKDNGWQYIISYKDSSGKWKQKSKQGFKATTAKKVPQEVKDAATEEVKNIKAKLVNNETLKDGIITFDSFCKTYLDHERLYRAENTIEVKERAFKKFNSLNEMIISDITSLNIQNCVDEMVKEGLSKVTIKHYLTLVKTMFNSAVEQHEIIAINPVKKIKLPEFESTKEKTALNQP
jgi:hypothetical protein